MVLVDINLSSISLVPLLLSVGLCIDYCTHIAHAFSEARGSASQRVHAALRTRGLAVFNAGISTGLSVLLLAWGGSAIFTTFFWMLLGVVIVGLGHALLVVPAALSLLPGENHTPTTRTIQDQVRPNAPADARAYTFDELPTPPPFTTELVASERGL